MPYFNKKLQIQRTVLTPFESRSLPCSERKTKLARPTQSSIKSKTFEVRSMLSWRNNWPCQNNSVNWNGSFAARQPS